MPSREYYLQQAKLLSNMAAVASDKIAAARFAKFANEYMILADAVADDPVTASHPAPQAQQQEQQQQQQHQQEPPKDDKGE